MLTLWAGVSHSPGVAHRLWDPTAWLKALRDLSAILLYPTGVYRQEGARLSLRVQSGRSRGSGHVLQQGRLQLDKRKESSPLSRRLSNGTGWFRSLGMLHPWRWSEHGWSLCRMTRPTCGRSGTGDNQPCPTVLVVRESSDPISYFSYSSVASPAPSLWITSERVSLWLGYGIGACVLLTFPQVSRKLWCNSWFWSFGRLEF